MPSGVRSVRKAGQHANRQLAQHDSTTASLFEAIVSTKLIQQCEELIDRDDDSEAIANKRCNTAALSAGQ